MPRIIYVDDEDDIREIAHMAIELDPELEVRSCASGAEALAVARVWQPDLVLLDVMMPCMDGPAVLSELRNCPDTANVPVVFITARRQPSEIERLISMGGKGVLAKPFDPLKLAQDVKDFL